MTETTKPAPGLGAPIGKPVVPPGLRVSPFIDYIKLVLRFPAGLQKSSIEKNMPREWRRSEFIKLTFAPHIPSAKRTARNACDCYTLTIHEPHKHRFSVDQLWIFLLIAGATLDREMSTVEWGVDFYPSKEAPLNRPQLCQLAEDITRCLNIRGIGLKLTPALATSRKKGHKKHTENLAEDLDAGWSVYVGEQPDWKTDATQHRWQDCIGFKCYYKVTDKGQDLPESEQRARLEFTASATNCPVDAIALLENSRAAKKKLATYFWLDLKTSGLLHVIQHAIRACWASIPSDLLETARKQHKSPSEIYYKAVGEAKCEVIYHPDDAMRPGRRRQGNTDSSWNDRITKSFERLTVGL